MRTVLLGIGLLWAAQPVDGQVMRLDSLRARGLALLEAGAYNQSLEAWNLAIATANRAEFFYYRGLCYYFLGSMDQAVLSELTATRLDPAFFLAYRALAELYWAKVDFDRCLEAVSKALEIRPDDAESRFIRGRLYVARGRFEQAITDYDFYISARPTDPDGHYMRGKAYRGAGRHDQAEQSYRTALQFRPGWADALNDLALVLLSRNRPHEALPFLDEAVAVAPNYATAHFNRGVVLQELHRMEEACLAWQRAEELGDPDALKYLQRHCH